MHPSDCACTREELEMFKGRQVQTVLENTTFVTCQPKNSISDVSMPIEFDIDSKQGHYIDLRDIHLHLFVKAVKIDPAANAGAKRSDLVAGDEVALVNNALNSIFSNIVLSMKDQKIEDSNDLNPYKSYLINLLSYGQNVKKTQLKAAGWEPDIAASMEARANQGFLTRRTDIIDGKRHELYGQLPLDLFTQNKYLISGSSINLTLYRAKAEFIFQSLKANNSVKNLELQIQKARLYVRYVEVAPSILMEHEAALSLQNVPYSIQRTRMSTFSINQNTVDFSKQSAFSGQMPKLIVLGMVDSRAYHGSFAHNPFNFQHFNVNHVALLNGSTPITGEPFRPDFDNTKCSREYIMLYHALEQFGMDESMGITPTEFLTGTTLFAFNTCPDQSISQNAQPYNNATLTLELKFKEKLATSINVICMAIYDGTLEIDKDRNVRTSYRI